MEDGTGLGLLLEFWVGSTWSPEVPLNGEQVCRLAVRGGRVRMPPRASCVGAGAGATSPARGRARLTGAHVTRFFSAFRSARHSSGHKESLAEWLVVGGPSRGVTVISSSAEKP